MTATAPPKTFDRRLLRIKRDRAAQHIDAHNFLHTRTAARLMDHMLPIKKTLHNYAVWGAHTDQICMDLAHKPETQNVYWLDISQKLLTRGADKLPENCHYIVGDEEFSPFAHQSLDAIISNLTLHTVNDLKGALIQARMALKPGSPFVAAIVGGDSLAEFRRKLIQIEMEETGGASPHIAPFIDIRTLGNMMQGLGFVDPVMDSETVDIQYSSLSAVLSDLRGMGEGNVLQERASQTMNRHVWTALNTYFTENGPIDFQIEILYMLGWTSDKPKTA